MTQEPDIQNTEASPDPAAKSNQATTPDQATTPEKEASFGWNAYAERINGRFAMVGFVALLVLELFTHQDFFSWLGLR